MAADIGWCIWCDYLSIDQDIVTCGVLNIEKMCDNAKRKDQKAEDNVQANEAEPIPVPRLSVLITAFETEKKVCMLWPKLEIGQF